MQLGNAPRSRLTPSYSVQVLEARKAAIQGGMSDAGHAQSHIGFALTDAPRVLPALDPEASPLDEPPPPEALSAQATAASVAAGAGFLDTLLTTYLACDLASEHVPGLRESVQQVTDVPSMLHVRPPPAPPISLSPLGACSDTRSEGSTTQGVRTRAVHA